MNQLFLNNPVVILMLLLGLSSCTKKPKEQEAPQATEISILEKVKLKELNGTPINLNQYQGKTIFINFWATWCGPCIKEMPSIERAKAILKDSKIDFLVASNESIEQIQNFVKERNLNLNYVQLQNMEELNIPALPTTFIISPSGKLVFSEAGYREWDEPANIELLTQIMNRNE